MLMLIVTLILYKDTAAETNVISQGRGLLQTSGPQCRFKHALQTSSMKDHLPDQPLHSKSQLLKTGITTSVVVHWKNKVIQPSQCNTMKTPYTSNYYYARYVAIFQHSEPPLYLSILDSTLLMLYNLQDKHNNFYVLQYTCNLSSQLWYVDGDFCSIPTCTVVLIYISVHLSICRQPMMVTPQNTKYAESTVNRVQRKNSP